MNNNKKDSEDQEEEFVFDDSEKLNLSKYNGLKGFNFGESTEIIESSKYNGLKGFEFDKSSQTKESREKNVSDLSNYKNKIGILDKDYIKYDLVNEVADKEKLEFINKHKEFTQTNLMKNELKEKVIKRNKVPDQKKEKIGEVFSKSDEFLPHKPLSEPNMLAIQPLQLAVLTIYHICEIFAQNSGIDKKFFSGNELDYTLDRHSQYFYSIKKKLKENDLIQYYGIFTRRKNVNNKVYIITDKGLNFAINIIKSEKQQSPRLFNELILSLEERFIEYNKELINTENNKRILYYFNDPLHQGIICIYFICEKFPQFFSITKNYFSKDEFITVINKESKFFSKIKDKLKSKNLIGYYGTFSRKSKSNEKVYVITDKGITFSEKLMALKTKTFPNLFDNIFSIFEKRYIEYNKELINDKNADYIIRSKKSISNHLKKLAEKNNLEILSSFETGNKEISFQCKICKKKFKETYYNIKKRQSPQLFCPYCFPELKRGIYISKELRENIAKYTLIELKKKPIYNLQVNDLPIKVNKIKETVCNQINFLISDKNVEFIEYIQNYVYDIIHFLTKIQLLNETNQKISISNVAKETHSKNLISLSHWEKVTKEIIKYLRKDFNFNIRTRLYDIYPQIFRNSVRIHKTFYKLINNRSITYLDIDYKTKIKVNYDGRCQGINGHCEFNIDYKFLPALSYHHLLKKYKKIITRKGFEYIQPREIIAQKFDKALKLMETQVRGLKLACTNCHSFEHDVIYNFSSIFIFLNSLSLTFINENPSGVLNTIKTLTEVYYLQNKENYKSSVRIYESQRKAEIKYHIKTQILKFVKKKYVIEFLFGMEYICPICKKTNINDHLNCFHAHHTNNDLFENGLEKITFSEEFKTKPVDWLIQNLIIQECIYICGNCHKMLHAKYYRDSVLIILKNKEDEKFIDEYYNNLLNEINKLRNKILEWKTQLMDNSLNYYQFPSL